MGQLTLIRHGQARAFEKDSDRLTELGELQPRKLAEYWLRQGVTFTECFAGSLNRQRHTAALVEASYRETQQEWPLLQTLPELNEYDAEGILQRLAPALAERDATFRQLCDAFEQHRQTPERNRYFQRMFEAVGTCWVRGELLLDEVESYAAFRARVQQAFQHILQQAGTGRRIAVFTSGGVIGLAVQMALAAPAEKALELNWRVRNCSLTEFTFSATRLSLDSFNALPHLNDQALWSYR